MKQIAILLMVGAGVAGCIDRSPAELRRNAGPPVEIDFHEPFAQVWQRLVRVSRQCYIDAAPVADLAVDRRSGEILYQFWTLFPAQQVSMGIAEVAAAGESRTHVRIIQRDQRIERFIREGRC